MGLFEKYRTLEWFLRRPREYCQFMPFLRDRIRGPQQGVKIAQAWCRARSVTEAEALEQLTGQALDSKPRGYTDANAAKEPSQLPDTPTPFVLESIYPAEFATALRASDNCPIDFGGPGLLDLLYGVAMHWRPSRVIETGVAFGWSTMAILLALQEIPGSQLISNDLPFGGPDSARHVGCVVPEHLKCRWRLVQRADRESLPELLAEWPSIDMCHYDSDKSYFGRMWASRQLWSALRPGGILLIDDIDDNYAYRDFCIEVSQSPLIVGHRGKESGKFGGVLVKPSTDPRLLSK